MEIGYQIDKKGLTNKTYADMASWCNSNGATIEDKEDYLEIVAPPAPTQEEQLEAEKEGLQEWLNAHDYIGTKIATGRATVQDYATDIAEMTAKASRIDEINVLLGR